jgi:hypothetical protein
MIREIETASEPSVTGLVKGILHDLQLLIRQQLALFKHELKLNLQRSRQAILLLAAGVGVAAVGGVLLCFMLVYLLAWAFAALPLWVCFLIVGALCCAAGGGMLVAGIHTLKSVTVPEQSIEALKENVQWIRNPR